MSSSGTGRSLWRARKCEQQLLKTKLIPRPKTQVSISTSQKLWKPPQIWGKEPFLFLSGRLSSAARRGCGDTAGRRTGCRGHCRLAGQTGLGTRPRGCRAAGDTGAGGSAAQQVRGGISRDRSLQLARAQPSPEAPCHTPGCQELHTHPALPTLSPGTLNTLGSRKPCHAHFPVPKQAENGENI